MEKLSYTKGEAAKALGVTVKIIDKIIKQGHLHTLQVGSKVLIGRQALEDLLKQDLKLTSAYQPMSEEIKTKLREYKGKKKKRSNSNE